MAVENGEHFCSP